MLDKVWWKYKITDEQIQEIKAENGEAIRRFWEDNEALILNLIKSKLTRYDYYHRTKVADCVSQVYVDLPKYNYSNSRDISHGIFKSCEFCIFGYGQSYVSFNTPLESDNLYLIDTLVSKYDIEDCFDYSIENERLYNKVALMLFPKSAEKRSNFLRRI